MGCRLLTPRGTIGGVLLTDPDSHEANKISGDDAPLSDPKEDKLGYVRFASVVAESIRRQKAERGVVYAIHGTWGSGKTTVANFVSHFLQEDLAENGDLVLVRFNPWWFSGQEDLIRAFFSELLAAVGPRIEDQARTALKKLATKVSGAGSIIKLALNLTPIVKDLPEEWKKALTEAVGIAGDLDESEKTVYELKEEVSHALKKNGKRILVFIDDIDRLTVGEQFQIFKLVKSVGDLANVIYLMAFDQTLARSAIEKFPEFAGDAAFLQKIVQIPFELPIPSQTSLDDWLTENLNTIVKGDGPDDEARWFFVYDEIIRPAINLPRAVVSLSRALSDSWPPVAGNVNFIDFVALEAVRLFDNDIYQAIRKHSGWLSGRLESVSEQHEKRLADTIIQSVSENRRERADVILKNLFPRYAETVDQYANQYSQEELVRQRRVCCRQHFDTYFNFSVAEGTIERTELEQIIDSLGVDGMIRAIFSDYASRDRLEGGTMAAVLLDELRGSISSLNQKSCEALSRSLIVFGDILLTEDDEKIRWLSIPNHHRIRAALRKSLGRLPPARRAPVVLDAIANGVSLAVGAIIASALHGDHQPIDDHSGADHQHPLVTKREAAEIVSAWTDQLRRFIDDQSIFVSPLATYILFPWRDFEGQEAVYSWTNSIRESKGGKLWLARSLTGEAFSSDKGHFPLLPNHAEELADIDALANDLGSLMTSGSLEGDEYEIADRFLKGIRNREYH